MKGVMWGAAAWACLTFLVGYMLGAYDAINRLQCVPGVS